MMMTDDDDDALLANSTLPTEMWSAYNEDWRVPGNLLDLIMKN